MKTSKKPLPDQLGEEALELIAARFKLLSEPARLKLIIALEERAKNVSELVSESGMSQSNVSRHLQRLTESGILKRERIGVEIHYSISAKEIFSLCRHVCGSLRKNILARAKEIS